MRHARRGFTSPRRGEVDFRAKLGSRVRGFRSIERPEPPHPTPLPSGEREQTESVVRVVPRSNGLGKRPRRREPYWLHVLIGSIYFAASITSMATMADLPASMVKPILSPGLRPLSKPGGVTG